MDGKDLKFFLFIYTLTVWKSGEILTSTCAASLGTLVTTPLFDSDESYIAYPPLTNIHNDLRIDMNFKPMDKDGLMFFIGGKKMKVEDFVTLSLVDGRVEFRYELGTGRSGVWCILSQCLLGF